MVLDRSQRILAWRILHSKLHLGHTPAGRHGHAQYVCPHACSNAAPANLNHTFLTCPVAAAVVASMSSPWGP